MIAALSTRKHIPADFARYKQRPIRRIVVRAVEEGERTELVGRDEVVKLLERQE